MVRTVLTYDKPYETGLYPRPVLASSMGVTIRKPTARQCEDCGREEVWNDATGTWRVTRDDDGDRIVGDVYCIHEWDINGTFVPVETDDATDADAA